ncbi:MAG: STAS/SEC14 domain-containing protein [Anaerolineae bacterium]|nr:STAS/SEC14 domain-containing protein [Anaerolineae bacterium]
MMQEEMQPLCIHEQRAALEHEFVFQASNRAAVEAWAGLIEQLQLSHLWYNKGHLRLLLDARSAKELPLRYLFELLNDYNRSYPGLEAPELSLAFVHDPQTVILSIYEMIPELLTPPVTAKYFTDESSARAWLEMQNPS